MSQSTLYFAKFFENFAHPSTDDLSEDLKYQRFLFPAVLLFCLIDSLLFGIISQVYLESASLAKFSYCSAAIFVSFLAMNKHIRGSNLQVLLFIVSTTAFFIYSLGSFEAGNFLILFSRFAIYSIVGMLLSGRRFFQSLISISAFFAASTYWNQSFELFALPSGMTEMRFMDSLLISISLSSALIFALMWLYLQSCDFSLASMERQKRWHDSNRLTKEFVNLAGDMNAVMLGPLEDVRAAIQGLKASPSNFKTQDGLRTIRRASEVVYGIARSFGVLAQDQTQTYHVRINLDELVRYARIVCETQFKHLAVELEYRADEEALEFTGPSGRWLLLLVSLFQFMGEQMQKTGSTKLLLVRQRREDGWELLLTSDGEAPFEFPYELHQKLKEESTKELLEQTSGKAYIYLLDRWGLKLMSSRI